MANVCVACAGRGCIRLGNQGPDTAQMVCPLCDGNPHWPESVDSRVPTESLSDVFSHISEDSPMTPAEGPPADTGMDVDASADTPGSQEGNSADTRGNSILTALYERSLQRSLRSSIQETNALPALFPSRLLPEPTAANLALPEVEDHGGLLMVSDGFFHFTVLVPTMAPPSRSFTEADVENIGTTWTHGDSEHVPPFLTATKSGDAESADECCGICMQSFDDGEKLTALPCANRGCGSIWHLGCMHKWLNSGHNPACPLCRSEIEGGTTSAAATSTNAPTIAFIGNGMGSMGGMSGASSSSFSQELMGVLFQTMLLRATAPAQDTDMPNLARLNLSNLRNQLEDEFSIPRELSALA